MSKIIDVLNIKTLLDGTEKVAIGHDTLKQVLLISGVKTYVLNGLSVTDISDFNAGVNANSTVISNTNAANSAQGDATQALADAATALGVANSAQSDATSAKDKTDQITITGPFDADATKLIIDYLSVTAATDLDAIRVKLASITDVGSGVIISVLERSKLGSITITDNDSIITNTQIAQVLRFSRSETKQSLSGSNPNLNCDNGYNADFPMTVNAVINITNAPAGVVSGGYVILRDTNGYTLTITLAGSSTNVAKMVGAEDLPAGASDTAILTWIYDGTYLTYNIGKRTEA